MSTRRLSHIPYTHRVSPPTHILWGWVRNERKLKAGLHSLYWQGFSPVWFLTYWVREQLSQKALQYSLHSKGFFSNVDTITPEKKQKGEEGLSTFTALRASLLWEPTGDEWKNSCHKRLTNMLCTQRLCLVWEIAPASWERLSHVHWSQGFTSAWAANGVTCQRWNPYPCSFHMCRSSPAKTMKASPGPCKFCSWKACPGESRLSSVPTPMCSELIFLGRLSLASSSLVVPWLTSPGSPLRLRVNWPCSEAPCNRASWEEEGFMVSGHAFSPNKNPTHTKAY